jgi:hypothetical protein
MKKEIKMLGGEGILNENDLISFEKAEQRIIQDMDEGVWYDAEYIIKITKQREGLRRLRNLRKKGYIVQKIRMPELRTFFYRIIKEDQPSSLFNLENQ